MNEERNATAGAAWTRHKERGNYWAIRAVVLLYRFGGKFLVLPVVYIVTTYFFLTHAKTRRYSRAYLTKVAASNGVIKPTEVTLRLVWQHYMAFAHALVYRIAAWMGQIHYRDVDFPERETMMEEQGSQQGSVILGAHFGNMDMCRALVAKNQGLTMNVIVNFQDTEHFNRALKSIDPGLSVNLIAIGGIDPATAIQIQDKLESGESLVMFSDRISPESESRNIDVDFLGEKVTLPEGPFRLAVSLACPVYFMTCVYEHGRYKMHYHKLWDGKSGHKRREKIQALVAGYIGILTALCKAHPLQWFNFYDYWCEFTDKK